jgi:hypothetical protein
VVVEHLVAPSSEVGSDLLKLRRQPTDSLRDINSRDTATQLTKDNDLLKSFSYRVEQTQDGSYSIYHGDQLVIAGITKISSVSVSERQDDFIFMAWIPADRYWLVQSSGAKEWIEADVIRHRFQPPVYVHDDLVSVEWDERSGTYILTQNGQRVFTVPLKSTVSGDEIKRLTSWSGHWVLEVEGDVYIDGVSLSKQMGYDEVFEWRLLDGHPFYLFSKDSQFGVVYRDKVQEYKYDEVPHNLCCEPASLNPSGDGVMVWFYGLRSGNWYLVETTTRP